jgi:hypothetical protein
MTAKRRLPTTPDERLNRLTKNSLQNDQGNFITEKAIPPTQTSRTSYNSWDASADTPQICAGFLSPKSLAAEQPHDARLDATTPNPHGSAANLRLASWLIICPIPLHDSIKERLASVMSGREARSKALPSLVLQSLDAIRMRVRDMHPILAGGCHHSAHHDCCSCCPKGGSCTPYTQCRDAFEIMESKQESLLSKCERVLDLSLGISDGLNKRTTHDYVPSSSPVDGAASVVSPHIMDSNTLFDGSEHFLDSFPSKYTQRGRLAGQTTLHGDDCSGEGPLNPSLASMEWTAEGSLSNCIYK